MTEGRSLVRHSAGNRSCQRQKQLFMSGFCTGGCPGQRFHCFFFQGSGHYVSCSMCMQVCIYTVMVLMMTCLSVLMLKPFDVFPVQVFYFGFCVPCFSRLVMVLMGPMNCQHVHIIFSCFKVKREKNPLGYVLKSDLSKGSLV